jgi:Flp pilus assembly protein TadB
MWIDFFNMPKSYYISIGLALLAGLGLSTAFTAITMPLIRKSVEAITYRITTVRNRVPATAPEAIRKRFNQTKNRQLPRWFAGWAEQLEPKLLDAGVGMSAMRYMLFIVVGGLIGFFLGIVILKNIPAAIIIAASAFLLPEQYLSGKIAQRREKIINQLAPAVRIFYAEYNDTPQVERALLITGERMSAPLGPILFRAGRQLAASHDPDVVFAELAKKLDFYHGRMFAQLGDNQRDTLGAGQAEAERAD